MRICRSRRWRPIGSARQVLGARFSQAAILGMTGPPARKGAAMGDAIIQKGQGTSPKPMRQRLGMRPGEEVQLFGSAFLVLLSAIVLKVAAAL